MTRYLLSIDQGTTSSRAIIFDQQGNVVASSQQEFKQLFPANGWVEHGPEALLSSVITTCRQAIAKSGLEAKQIVSVGITNQRETTLIWHKKTGKTLHNAIVWQDRRTADYCKSLKDQGHETLIQEKTGLLLDPYFSATKLKWLLDNVKSARELAEAGDLAFGTVDTFLLWHLSNGQQHRTDATNASRTLLFNIHQQQWDEELLELFDIPRSVLPEVMDSFADFGVIDTSFFGHPIPIQGIAGDQQAALFGQTCFQTGMAKSTYGTGCFLMVNTGSEALSSKNRLLTTVGYRLNGETTYALEGSIFVAGAVVQWLRDELKVINSAAESEAIAAQMPLTHGVYFVPAFTGLGAPYWQPDARGAIVGLSRGSGINEIVSAALQSVCYQSNDLLEAIEKDGIRIEKLRVDGGMVENAWLMQLLADILAIDVERPSSIETTALGVAYLAGLKAGVFDSLTHIQSLNRCDKRFSSEMSPECRDELLLGWQQAVSGVLR